MWRRVCSKLSGARRRLRPRQRAKQLVHGVLTQWKWATSSSYRQAIERLRHHRHRYQATQPLRGCDRVLLICEASIPQCFKYRVQQRQESLALLGIDSQWVAWQDEQACLSALQCHGAVVFYRVPRFAGVERLLQEARRLQLPISWEVDDLIFDAAVLRASSSLRQLDWLTYRGLLKGARLYRRALRAADRGIASTACLAQTMANDAGIPVDVIHNGLDRQTLKLARALKPDEPNHQPHGLESLCRIVYGSGTNTHNQDFLEAATALLELLREEPRLRLRIIGDLTLPRGFAEVEQQVERFQARSYASYLELLSECQINLAPLEQGLFNDCKSNIKWLEAAALGIPSVCSDRAEFSAAIENGVNGVLCSTADQWKQALRALVDDPQRRLQMGEAARTSAWRDYAPEQIAHREVASWWQQTQARLRSEREHPPLPRVLSINVYYGPQSFGGATLVAEQLNRHLVEYGAADVAVFCLMPSQMAAGKALHRYSVDNLQVFAVPEHLKATSADSPPDASSEAMLEQFAAVLDCFKPDMIHVHCIQGIGLGVLGLARQRNIPYVITLHDAWWLCALQFMLKPDGHYCHQTTINQQICSNCTGQPSLVQARSLRMREALEQAATLLAPSRFFAELFEANGYHQVRLHRNGVVPPQPTQPQPISRSDQPIRFGYLGGNVAIKGFPQIQGVFRRLAHCHDLELVLVDNALNLGHPSYFAPDLRGLKNVRLLPGFDQTNADQFYGEIDVLLFPTRWKESFGLAIREALARGIWVISSDAGGTVEDVHDGVNGRIIPFEDSGDALERAVLEAKERVMRVRQGIDPRPTTVVRSYAEQADELACIIHGLLERQAG